MPLRAIRFRLRFSIEKHAVSSSAAPVGPPIGGPTGAALLDTETGFGLKTLPYMGFFLVTDLQTPLPRKEQMIRFF